VVERGLVPTAVSALTTHAFTALPFEALGPTKALLKRFFSAQPWGPAEDGALADAIGPGQGWWREDLADDLVMEFGWEQGRFSLRVEGGTRAGKGPRQRPGEGLAATFDRSVVPEATPNPRTLAFRTGRIHEGESRSYRSVEVADDPRVARLFRSFPDLATVLVAQDFVALTLRRADAWESLIAAVLDAVAEEFAAAGSEAAPGAETAARHPGGPAAGPVRSRRESRLDRAWRELGSLRPSEPGQLDQLLAAARHPDAAFRQVAANLLGQAPADVAQGEWSRLLGDRSRMVRRSVVDAAVDAGRDELRPLLERALGDADAWARWKALRGLADLGAARSDEAIRPLTEDPDFRVRLEAHAALRR
jgi:hypothetical protein